MRGKANVKMRKTYGRVGEISAHYEDGIWFSCRQAQIKQTKLFSCKGITATHQE